MNCLPTAFSRITLLLFVFVAGVAAQSVKFNVARAELHCPLSKKQEIRVLLDSSLKGHLDKYRTGDPKEGCTDKREPHGSFTSDPCKPFRIVQSHLENSFLQVFSEHRPDPTKEAEKVLHSLNFYLIEVKTGTRLWLENVFDVKKILHEEPLPQAGSAGSHLTLEFAAVLPIDVHDPEKAYVLMANVKELADGKPKPNTHIIPLETAACEVPAAKLKAQPTEEQANQAKIDKEKNNDVLHRLVDSSKAKAANVGVSFGLKGSKRNYIYTHDIALRIGRLHRLGFGGAYDINWFFLDHKYSSDEGSPLDDLKFGMRANHVLLLDRFRSRRSERNPLDSLTTSVSGYFETDFLFSDQVNFIGAIQTGLPLHVIQNRSTILRLTPIAGYELGYRLKDETPLGKNDFLSRGVFGLNAFFVPYRKEKFTPLELDVEYTRRVLAKDEPEYFVNADNKEVFGDFNKGPKDYVKARATFNYNKLFAPFIQYSYGRTPPKYTLQKHSIEAGLKVYLKWED